MSEADVLHMLERMAQLGTAPDHGCGLFSVGFDEPIDRLRRTVIEKRFRRGASDMKFVIGPYGSGKTHFLRHLQEVASSSDCVTSEVPLNRDVDFTKTLVVYREIAREIRAPGAAKRGMDELLRSMVTRIKEPAVDSDSASVLVDLWFGTLDRADLLLPDFPRILKRAIKALEIQDDTEFDACVRWLSGGINDRALAKELGVQAVTQSEENLYARRSMLTLFQVIRHAGFQGMVVAYDEAEQGLSVDRKKTERILSMLQSNINAFADVPGASTLVVFALTPDFIAKMETFPALQQRVADPGPGLGFFDGNTRAARIDLGSRNSDDDLKHIGWRLVDLLYDHHGDEIEIPKEGLLDEIGTLAERVLEEDATSGNRRTMVKRTATKLLHAYEGEDFLSDEVADEPIEDEV